MLRRRCGFTLIELLVVIAIIGVLIGLLLPAVQKVRESANRIRCANNLKQLGLALQLYHDSYDRFPFGSPYDGNPKTTVGVNAISAFVYILPFLEMDNLYRQWNLNANVQASANSVPAKTTVIHFFCPTRGGPRLTGAGLEWSAGDYVLSAGTGKTNSTNVIDWVGMFNTNLSVAIREVTDGTSNTIAMGEKYIKAFQDANTDGNEYRFGFHSHRNTVSPMNAMPLSAWGDTDCTFGSWHPGGAQFLFVDGSVHFLPANIGLQLYQNLSNRADGNAVTVP